MPPEVNIPDQAQSRERKNMFKAPFANDVKVLLLVEAVKTPNVSPSLKSKNSHVF